MPGPLACCVTPADGGGRKGRGLASQTRPPPRPARAGVLLLAALLLAPALPDALASQPAPERLVLGFQGAIPADAEPWLRARGAEVLLRVDGLALLAVQARDPALLLAQAHARADVRYAAPDGTFQAQAHPRNPLAPNPPQDPAWGSQWGPRASGSAEAWTFEAGDRAVVVAVLDSGVLAAHPDLTPACALCSASPQDGYGHGTHVAGILAAQANNALGMAGGAPGISLLSIKVLNDLGTGYWSQLAAGIMLASAAGARVVSMSVGGWCSEGLTACTPVEDAVAFAEERGVLLVASVGNLGCGNCVMWPARYPQVLAVGATTYNDTLAEFSARGPEVDLVAPGVHVNSTMSPGSYLGTRVCLLQGDLDPLYCNLDGTSMATPLVSAAAALLMSHCPAMTGAEARALLEASAQDLGLPGWDSGYGSGRLDAGRALAQACA